MPYAVPTLDQIRSDILRDMVNLDPTVNVDSDSDNYIRATAVASAIEGLYQHQLWAVRQIFPDSADEDYLERHAGLRKLDPKDATTASGSIAGTGTPGKMVGAGLQLKSAAGAAVTTTAQAIVDATGNVIIPVQAATSGVAGNLDPGTVLTFSAAPDGIASVATVVNVSGGTDAETPASLLARLLSDLRDPDAGGKDSDYIRWATSVDGITAAFVYPHRRAPGKVDVVVVSGSGLATNDQIAAAQTLIDANRPAACPDCLVLSPTLKPIAIVAKVKLNGVQMADVQQQAEDAIRAYFDTLVPGDTYINSRVEGILTDLTGVVDRQVTLPGANVATTLNANTIEWARFGSLTLSLLP